MIGSCDLTPYEEAVSASAGHDAAAGDSFQVRGGLPNEMVKVIGHAGAPDGTITGRRRDPRHHRPAAPGSTSRRS